MDKKYLSNEEIIAMLRALAEQLGKTPTQLDVEAEESVLTVPKICKSFGSYNNALIAAGLKPNKVFGGGRKPRQAKGRETRFNKDELIKLIKLKAEELGYTPTWSQITLDKRFPSPATLARLFGGTYNQAMIAAGLTPHGFRERPHRKKAPK
ncbi:hypothetical protein IJI76_01835 [Candidatus Saccharibacteria bacterium]|nr:hypothetical protein [Candidatus Saccharibacteria bacterium]